MSNSKISIITVTYNANSVIKDLADSIRQQDQSLFEWIIVDGGSTDGTLEFLDKFKEQYAGEVHYISEHDFGVYDALNKAVKLANYEYYVVIGADDIFLPQAIQNYVQAIEANDTVDIFLSNVIKDGNVHGGFYGSRGWLGHQQVFKGSHSIGMLIKRQLHDEFGLYSNRFPLLADGYFLKKLLVSGKVSFSQLNFTSGVFATEGISNQGKLQSLAETWQIQMLTEKEKFLQTVLFILKIIGRSKNLYTEFTTKKRTDGV